MGAVDGERGGDFGGDGGEGARFEAGGGGGDCVANV